MKTEIANDVNAKVPKAAGWGGADIQHWDPEDEKQWASYGKKIAWRNLWISIPCLLCGFAVWLYGVVKYLNAALELGYDDDSI